MRDIVLKLLAGDRLTLDEFKKAQSLTTSELIVEHELPVDLAADIINRIKFEGLRLRAQGFTWPKSDPETRKEAGNAAPPTRTFPIAEGKRRRRRNLREGTAGLMAGPGFGGVSTFGGPAPDVGLDTRYVANSLVDTLKKGLPSGTAVYMTPRRADRFEVRDQFVFELSQVANDEWDVYVYDAYYPKHEINRFEVKATDLNDPRFVRKLVADVAYLLSAGASYRSMYESPRRRRKLVRESYDSYGHGNPPPPEGSNWADCAWALDMGVLDLDNVAHELGYKNFRHLDAMKSPRSFKGQARTKLIDILRRNSLKAEDMSDEEIIDCLGLAWTNPLITRQNRLRRG